jgi:hypothetical protein
MRGNSLLKVINDKNSATNATMFGKTGENNFNCWIVP